MRASAPLLNSSGLTVLGGSAQTGCKVTNACVSVQTSTHTHTCTHAHAHTHTYTRTRTHTCADAHMLTCGGHAADSNKGCRASSAHGTSKAGCVAKKEHNQQASKQTTTRCVGAKGLTRLTQQAHLLLHSVHTHHKLTTLTTLTNSPDSIFAWKLGFDVEKTEKGGNEPTRRSRQQKAQPKTPTTANVTFVFLYGVFPLWASQTKGWPSDMTWSRSTRLWT